MILSKSIPSVIFDIIKGNKYDPRKAKDSEMIGDEKSKNIHTDPDKC